MKTESWKIRQSSAWPCIIEIPMLVYFQPISKFLRPHSHARDDPPEIISLSSHWEAATGLENNQTQGNKIKPWKEHKDHNTNRNTELRQSRGFWSIITSLKENWREKASSFQGSNFYLDAQYRLGLEVGPWHISLHFKLLSSNQVLAIFLHRKRKLKNSKKD